MSSTAAEHGINKGLSGVGMHPSADDAVRPLESAIGQLDLDIFGSLRSPAERDIVYCSRKVLNPGSTAQKIVLR